MAESRIKSSKRLWTLVFACLLLPLVALVLLALRPVPLRNAGASLLAEGRLVEISASTSMDIVLRLANSPKRFYINRGLERGLGLEALGEQLLGQQVSISYPRYWTPLDPTSSLRHVSKLEHGGSVLFDETN